jgi:hypothetical protein
LGRVSGESAAAVADSAVIGCRALAVDSAGRWRLARIDALVPHALLVGIAVQTVDTLKCVTFLFGVSGGLERTAADGRVVLRETLRVDSAGSGQSARILAGSRNASCRQRAIRVGDTLARFATSGLVRITDQTFRTDALVAARSVATHSARVARAGTTLVHVGTGVGRS